MHSSRSDLTGILTELKKRTPDVTFRSGTVSAWNAETGQNTITIAGAELSDLPTLIATEKLAIGVGDVVGILRIRSQYFVLGRIVLDEGSIVVRDPDGNITVEIRRTDGGGGQISTYHPNGTSHMYAGQLYNVGTGQITGQGFLIQQDNEVDLVGVAPLEPGGPVLIRLRDPDGNLIFNTDQTRLLDRPYVEQPMYPVLSVTEPWETGSTEFISLWLGRMWVTHPNIHVQVRAWCSAGATAEWAVYVNDVGITSPLAIPNTGGSSDYYDAGSIRISGSIPPYSYAKLEIKARRTSPGGTVTIFPYGVTKRGT